jgi:hypothetical protein
LMIMKRYEDHSFEVKSLEQNWSRKEPWQWGWHCIILIVGAVQCTTQSVRGKQARLATTGVLVIKIGVIVIMIQSSRCFSNYETSKRLIVKTDILQ